MRSQIVKTRKVWNQWNADGTTEGIVFSDDSFCELSGGVVFDDEVDVKWVGGVEESVPEI